MTRLKQFPWLEIGLGVVVAAFGLWRASFTIYLDVTVPVLIALGMGAAVGLYRRAPAAALAIVWFTGTLQVLRGLDIALVQLAVVVVAYGASRYGRTATVVASGLSIPLGGIAVVAYAWVMGTDIVQESGLWQLLSLTTSATDLTLSSRATGLLLGFVLVLALLGAPWGAGLVVRLRAQGRRAVEEQERAEAETVRVRQLASVRADQARLARDVHDVVGHSLAVIVAQADSTRALGDDEIDRIRVAVANIAETARRSLGDVRSVLSDDPDGAGSGPGAGDVQSLVDGVRAGGTDVALEVLGQPRPLPPDLEVVAYRSLQELLTNALKHGAPGQQVGVGIDWQPDELRLSVRNRVGDAPGPGGGTGLAGTRDRLAAAGGELEAGTDSDDWVAVARVPVRRAGLAHD